MITDKKNFPSADVFGRSLQGVVINLLVRDVLSSQQFLNQVFGLQAMFADTDFAALRYENQTFMLHSDGAYRDHPGLSLVPESGFRGGGATLYLLGTDPDQAAIKAVNAGGHVIQEPVDKPHGLREAAIADPNGYLWSPAIAIKVMQ